jgi:hypothetical protein
MFHLVGEIGANWDDQFAADSESPKGFDHLPRSLDIELALPDDLFGLRIDILRQTLTGVGVIFWRQSVLPRATRFQSHPCRKTY